MLDRIAAPFEALFAGPAVPPTMDLDREQKINVVVSLGALALIIGAMMAIGATYSTNGGLSAQGGQMLVGTLVAFILSMAVVGYVLATKVTGAGGNDDDEAPELA